MFNYIMKIDIHWDLLWFKWYATLLFIIFSKEGTRNHKLHTRWLEHIYSKLILHLKQSNQLTWWDSCKTDLFYMVESLLMLISIEENNKKAKKIRLHDWIEQYSQICWSYRHLQWIYAWETTDYHEFLWFCCKIWHL